MKTNLALLILFFLSLGRYRASARIEIYPTPAGIESATDFRVKIKGQQVLVYDSRNSAFASFGTNEQVTVEVEFLGGNVNAAEIRPRSLGSKPRIAGRKVSFTMKKMQKIVLLINENQTRKLLLFANPLEINKPSLTDPDVRLCFVPAEHVIEIGGRRADSKVQHAREMARVFLENPCRRARIENRCVHLLPCKYLLRDLFRQAGQSVAPEHFGFR